MNKASICTAAACVLISFASARGQSPQFPYDRIEVVLDGISCSHAPRTIYAVVDAGDRKEHSLTKIGDRLWAASIGAWLPDRPASVRWAEGDAGAMRTECLPGVGMLRTNILRFTFSQCYEAEEVRFTIDPRAIDSRYVRQQGPCREPVDFRHSRTAYAVGFDVEEVRLLFGPDAKTTRRRGLLVNAVVEAKTDKEFVLTRDWVAHALSTQRNHHDGAKPNLSPNAIDLDLDRLTAIQFSSVKIGRR